MNIDPAMLDFMQQTQNSLGRIEANQVSGLEFTKAVNAKATATQRQLDEHTGDHEAHGAIAAKGLSDHQIDQEAHGAKAAAAKAHDVVAWIGVIFGYVGLAAALWGHR